MNRINLSHNWKREHFENQKNFERCFCVWNSFDRKVEQSCYTVIENCPTCEETGLMTTEEKSTLQCDSFFMHT